MWVNLKFSWKLIYLLAIDIDQDFEGVPPYLLGYALNWTYRKCICISVVYVKCLFSKYTQLLDMLWGKSKPGKTFIYILAIKCTFKIK
jgi:hypothetical protein